MEEIAWPLGADILVAIPRSQLYRTARTYHAGWLDALWAVLHLDISHLWTNLVTYQWMPFSDQRAKALNVFSDYELLYNWNPDLLEVPISSTNMFANARGLAHLFATLYGFGYQDSKTNLLVDSTAPSVLFKHWQTIEWMLEPVDSEEPFSAAKDPVLGRKVAFTRSGLMIENSPKGNPIYGYWDDIMGQGAFVDPIRNLSFAYVTNHAHGRSLHRDFIINALQTAVYDCID